VRATRVTAPHFCVPRPHRRGSHLRPPHLADRATPSPGKERRATPHLLHRQLQPDLTSSEIRISGGGGGLLFLLFV
jgi:hypothetical protein